MSSTARPAAFGPLAPPHSSVRRLVRGAGIAAGAAAGLGAAALLYGRFVELNRFTVRRESLAVLPPGSPDLRVLHLSDLHMIPGQRRKIEFVRSLTGLAPDLVVSTGDNFSHPEALDPLLEALDPLLDLPGVYVPGSNCYFAPQLKNPARYLWKDTSAESAAKAAAAGGHPASLAEGQVSASGGARRVLPFRRMHEHFDARGWTGLVNRTDSLTVRGVCLDFSGVDDPHLGYDEHPGFAPQAHARDPQRPSLRVGVLHAPYQRCLERFAEDGAEVVFAGHTHGGQICLPGGRAVVSNCDLEPARAKGISYQRGIMPVQVSAGLGTSRFAPVRLFCPPEAVLVTLTAARAEPPSSPSSQLPWLMSQVGIRGRRVERCLFASR
ncbi:metallophosphoesterase [Rothia kristinae]|uniref:metallophosphoesterase n=1 Tax=Rothia kristinae TaxID=37923 RepID=UPI000D6BF74B|nr:metallophosphoesterase [Rothia kristinae]TDP54870.1 putative MPP superfamily phosphohydrolase [Kocuria sp. AG109]MBG7587124.1 metallophosphoesterase [Rothia kristinae]MCT1357093.1 metallophosphoesterase [Rothia kristinae]MCT1392568.1 metallophosphoesterase [Rothia kristinae]MCT1506572.1 metallophosphoesterase [Rothia kristinae]